MSMQFFVQPQFVLGKITFWWFGLFFVAHLVTSYRPTVCNL